jgi:hypothetical protein
METTTNEFGRPTMEPLTTSAKIDQVAAALALAQAKMEGAKKDAANPFFKSKYADLASVWEACREALTEQGLAVVQVANGDGEPVDILITDYDGDNMVGSHVEKGARIRLTTILTHKSGQWIGGTSTMTAQNMGPQAAGSCLTYLRRYSLAALVGVAPEDDDGNAANSRKGGSIQRSTGGGQQAQRDYERARLDSEMADESRISRPPAANDTIEVVDGKTGVVTRQPRVTTEQLLEISVIAKRGGWNEDGMRKEIKKRYNVERAEDLGRGQAIDLIRFFGKKVEAAKEAVSGVAEHIKDLTGGATQQRST